MPLTRDQWDAFAAAHPQDDFKLSLPEDIEFLWGQVREFFLDRQGPLGLPEAEEVCLWDTSDTDAIDLLMTVDLPSGVRIASLTFTPTSLHTSRSSEEPCGTQAAREAIDALLAMRADLVAQAQHASATVSAQTLVNLCVRHGHAFRLSGDPVSGTTELRVSWPTGHPSGVRSLHGVWGQGASEPNILWMRRRDPATGLTNEEPLTPTQAAVVLTEGTTSNRTPVPGEGEHSTLTTKDLLRALFRADREGLSPSAHVVIAENGEPGLGDPVVAVRIQQYAIDPDTETGLLGTDAADKPGATSALVLFTEH